MKKLLLIVLVALVVAGVVQYKRHSGSPEPTGYAGYAEAELVTISSPLSGEILSLDVQRGDTVKKGARLFSLERAEELAARAEAEELLRESRTRVDMARLDFDRAKSLREKRVTSPEDFDTAQHVLLGAQHSAAARARALEQADWRLTQKVRAAPADGLVYDTYFRPGEWVPPGTPVLALLPPEYLKVRFFVPESDLGRVTVGDPLEIVMDGLDQPLPGKVSFVSPKAEYTLPIIYSRENRNKLVFLVEASLDPKNAVRLHSGAPVEVHLAPSTPPHGD